MRQNGNAEFAGVDNAGVDISARCGKGGLCRSGQCGIVHSCKVHPCHMVPHCPFPQCPPLPRADMSTPAFSTPPFLTVPLCPLPQILSTRQNMVFSTKIRKILGGGGTAPSPDPSPVGPPHASSHRRLRHLDTSHSKILGTPLALVTS